MKKPLLFLALILASEFLQAQVRTYDFYIETEKGKPVLNLSSAHTFPCLGYRIRTTEYWNQDTLLINIGGFITPEECYPYADPAREKIEMLGIRTKIFCIMFRWEEFKDKKYEDKWMVSVNGEVFKVTPLISTFSRYSK